MTVRPLARNLAITLLALGKLGPAATPALAQKLSFDVGPMAGIALASWRGAAGGSAGFRTGFVGGGFLTIGLNKHFALEPQVLYVRKGTETVAIGGKANYTQEYVEIPLLFKGMYRLARPLSFAPTFFAGPAVAFQTSCTFRSSGPIRVAMCDSLYAGGGASMRHIDAILVFGGGFQVGPFAFLTRYDLGLTKILVMSTPQDYRTKAWLMSVGFRLPLDKR